MRRPGRRSTTAIRWSRSRPRAIGTIDVTGDYAKLKGTKVLYVRSPTDKLFDIALSPAYVSDMRKAGIDVTCVELPSNKGPYGRATPMPPVSADLGAVDVRRLSHFEERSVRAL